MTKPVHVPPYLTQEEVNALPDGTKIVVTWSGGNGPAVYTVRQVKWEGDYRYSVAMYKTRAGAEIETGDLDFVGDKKPYTLVTLAVP